MKLILTTENKQSLFYYLVQSKYWRKSLTSGKNGQQSVFKDFNTNKSGARWCIQDKTQYYKN